MIVGGSGRIRNFKKKNNRRFNKRKEEKVETLSDEIGQRVVTRRMGGMGDEALAERDSGVRANRIPRLPFRPVRFEQGYGKRV